MTKIGEKLVSQAYQFLRQYSSIFVAPLHIEAFPSLWWGYCIIRSTIVSTCLGAIWETSEGTHRVRTYTEVICHAKE